MMHGSCVLDINLVILFSQEIQIPLQGAAIIFARSSSIFPFWIGKRIAPNPRADN